MIRLFICIGIVLGLGMTSLSAASPTPSASPSPPVSKPTPSPSATSSKATPANKPAPVESLKKIPTPDIPCRIKWGNNCTSLRDLLQSIAEFLLAIAGTLFFFMVLYGGIQYLSGAGNEDQTGKAKATMLSAIIGLIIVTSAWAILRLVVEGVTGG